MTYKTCNGTGKVRGDQAVGNVWIEPCHDCMINCETCKDTGRVVINLKSRLIVGPPDKRNGVRRAGHDIIKCPDCHKPCPAPVDVRDHLTNK